VEKRPLNGFFSYNKERSFFMKNTAFSIFTFVLIAVTLGSCVSMQDRMMTPKEQAEATVLGPVEDKITVLRPFFITNTDRLKSKAYDALKEKAVEQYGYSNVEIRNITMKGRFSPVQLAFLLGPPVLGFAFGAPFRYEQEQSLLIGAIVGGSVAVPLNLIFHFERVTATGEAVLFGPGVSVLPSNLQVMTRPSNRQWSRMTNMQRIEFVLNNVAVKLINDMPADATIAILSIYSADRQTAEYVINELEYKLFESKKFTIVDRRRLEQIRREQNFQMSGDVDDASAVSIGNMLGATIVLTGDITGDAAGGLLVVRALDVQTARIIMMARERF
jgi:hypothetical protein